MNHNASALKHVSLGGSPELGEQRRDVDCMAEIQRCQLLNARGAVKKPLLMLSMLAAPLHAILSSSKAMCSATVNRLS